ncbi:peptidase S8 [Bacillus sp. V3-13]|nr:peptidase S8 [Bacillus sp. V3-13]
MFVIVIGILLVLTVFFNDFWDQNDKQNTTRLIDNSNKKASDIQLLNSTTNQIIPWGLKSLGLEKYQRKEKTKSTKIKVAILDSGILKEHEDLQGKVVKEFNAINPNQPIEDKFGHGTAIAGVIAAENNDFGIVGVAPNVEIYSVKILNDNGKGSIESLITGIEWSIENKVQVINISFGMSSNNPELHKIIKKAVNSGIIVVAAAGNNYGLNVNFPARYKDVISVTAVNSNYKIIPSYSAKGKIDYSLPGAAILTTSKDGKYQEYSGTSLAAAYMTGLVSIILQNEKKFNLDLEEKDLSKQVNRVLKKYSINIGDKKLYGNGFVKLSYFRE